MHFVYFTDTAHITQSISPPHYLNPQQRRKIKSSVVLQVAAYNKQSGHYCLTLTPTQAKRLSTSELNWFVVQHAVKIVNTVR